MDTSEEKLSPKSTIFDKTIYPVPQRKLIFNAWDQLLIVIPGRPVFHVVLFRYFQGKCHSLIAMGFSLITFVSSYFIKIMH